jgi:hypothetical protein
MAKPFCIALLFWVALIFSAAAQTTGTSGGVAGTNLASPYGAVSLPTGIATQTGSATTTGAAAASTGSTTGAAVPAGGSTTGSSPAAGSASGSQASALGVAGSTSSARATSGGSSATGTAAVSTNVPAWILCPPAGGTGLEPFVAGTGLSCAP